MCLLGLRETIYIASPGIYSLMEIIRVVGAVPGLFALELAFITV